jgi:hypothetical protein
MYLYPATCFHDLRSAYLLLRVIKCVEQPAYPLVGGVLADELCG